MDEVRIYSRTLSPGKVEGLAGKTVPVHKPFQGRDADIGLTL